MEIFLQNTEILKLDVEPFDSPLTFSVADMKQPDKRRTSASKTITIKGTASNMRVLQVFYNLSAADIESSNLPFNFDPRQRIEARAYDNGVIVFDGLLQILKAKIVNREYSFEAVLFSNTANIYNRLDNIKIAELGWSEYDHTLDKDIIRAAWDATVIKNGVATSNFTAGVPDGFGYIYSWFDLGFEYPAGTPRRQRTNQMVTGVYFREILEKIFAYLELDYDFTLNDDELFKRMVLFNKLGEQLSLSASEISARLFESQLFVFETKKMSQFGTGNAVNLQDTFEVNSSITTENVNLGLGNGVLVNAQGTYTYNINGDINLSVISSDASDFLDSNNRKGFFVIRRNGQLIESQNFEFPQVTTSGTTTISISLENTLLLNAGDVIDVVVLASLIYEHDGSVLPFFFPEVGVFDQFNLTFDLTAEDAPLEDGDSVVLSRFIPDMKCSDFLRSLLRMFNAYQVDEDGVVNIIPAKDYYGGTAPSQREDWTDKIDYAEVVEIEPPNSIQGKFYNAKWVDEDDRYHELYKDQTGERYGNYLYEITNTWQRGINDLEVGFSQSVPVQIDSSDQIIPSIYQTNNGVVEPYKGNAPRIFIYNGLIEVPQASFGAIHPSDPAVWGFPPSGDPLFIVDGLNWYYPQFSHTLDFSGTPEFDLNFKYPLLRYYDGSLSGGMPTDNLFERYWRVFLEELTSADAKVLTAYFNLSKLDIKNLDFSKLKEIEGVLYRLNLVEGFVGNEISTKCELIKVLKGSNRRIITIADGTAPFNPNDSTFIATVDQSGTDDPVAQNIFKNTMPISLSYRLVGTYNVTTSNDLFENATLVINPLDRDSNNYEIVRNSSTSFTIKTYNSAGVLTNGILNAVIEIKKLK